MESPQPRTRAPPRRLADEPSPQPSKRARQSAECVDKPGKSKVNKAKAQQDSAEARKVKPLLPKKYAASAKNVAAFLAFVHKRQMVWKARSEGQPKPWTEDRLLSRYLFCNIYRELDRGTIYFRAAVEAVLPPLPTASCATGGGGGVGGGDDGASLEHLQRLLWLSIVYRLMNKIETFELWSRSRIGRTAGKGEKGPRAKVPAVEDLEPFAKFLKAQRKKGVVLFTSAHQVMGLDRYVATLRAVRAQLPKLAQRLHANRADLRACFETLQALPNVGPFFAWQVVCDLIEEPRLLADGVANTWCQLGPGAKRGLARIFPHALLCGAADAELDASLALVQVHRAAFAALDLPFPYFDGRPLTLKEVEHALCEFEKYCNHMKGGRIFVSRADALGPVTDGPMSSSPLPSAASSLCGSVKTEVTCAMGMATVKAAATPGPETCIKDEADTVCVPVVR
jgi:hypothetical protein